MQSARHSLVSRAFILAAAATAISTANIGCSTAPHAPLVKAIQPLNPPVAHTIDPKASLTLAEITPVPALPAPTLAATEGEAPLEALMLYAKARGDEQSGQRYDAIAELERAARIDPSSFDIQNELARIYLSINSSGDLAETALENAARLKSDDLQTQTDLGRVCLSRGELAQATEHLRLALDTTEYQADSDESAVTDYYLAQSLQKQGYDRAALDSYTRLLKRLQNAPDSVRDNAEIQYWLSRPELLYAEVGRLREKQDDTPAALAAYRVVAERNPDDLDTRSHMVTLLMKLNRRQDASRLAIESIVHTHANRQSLEMLRTVYRGDGDHAVTTLQDLADQHPHDRTVLFALCDMLVADGQPQRAMVTLNKVEAATQDEKGAGDTQVVGRLFHLLSDQNKTLDAARLLIETSARRPDSTDELLPLWNELVAPWRAARIHPSQMQTLDVAPGALAARSYWVARTAVGRPELLKSALAESIAQQPPFRPAYRYALSQLFADPTVTSTARQQQINALVGSVEKADPALSQELLGIALLNDATSAYHIGDNTSASELASAATGAFNNAQKQGDLGPDIRSESAAAELLKPDAAAYERIMWKLIGDRPDDDAAYTELFHYYEDNKQAERAVAVSQSWLAADPNNVSAQLLHVLLLSRAGVKDEANKATTEIYQSHPNDPQVIDVCEQLLAPHNTAAGEPDVYTPLLESRVAKMPGDLMAVSQLVTQYVQQKRLSEADHLIDNARSAVSHDSDQLYFVAHLYDLTADPTQHAPVNASPTEQTLQMALSVDPHNAGANNDLGYEWADSGTHLAEAESMIRAAIQLEPDNGAYLDSLGWVLYKRGEFDASRGFLEKAVQPTGEADPVVLDHLGDDLYRLNQTADATARWKTSLEKVESRIKARQQDAANGQNSVGPDDELGALQLHLQQKLKQAEQGSPVNVAPVSDGNSKQVRASIP